MACLRWLGASCYAWMWLVNNADDDDFNLLEQLMSNSRYMMVGLQVDILGWYMQSLLVLCRTKANEVIHLATFLLEQLRSCDYWRDLNERTHTIGNSPEYIKTTDMDYKIKRRSRTHLQAYNLSLENWAAHALVPMNQAGSKASPVTGHQSSRVSLRAAFMLHAAHGRGLASIYEEGVCLSTEPWGQDKSQRDVNKHN